MPRLALLKVHEFFEIICADVQLLPPYFQILQSTLLGFLVIDEWSLLRRLLLPQLVIESDDAPHLWRHDREELQQSQWVSYPAKPPHRQICPKFGLHHAEPKWVDPSHCGIIQDILEFE